MKCTLKRIDGVFIVKVNNVKTFFTTLLDALKYIDEVTE